MSKNLITPGTWVKFIKNKNTSTIEKNAGAKLDELVAIVTEQTSKGSNHSVMVFLFNKKGEYLKDSYEIASKLLIEIPQPSFAKNLKVRKVPYFDFSVNNFEMGVVDSKKKIIYDAAIVTDIKKTKKQLLDFIKKLESY